MKKYYLGVDAGATKSHALICNSSGKIMELGKSGNSNPDIVGQDGFTAVINEALIEALELAGIDRDQIVGAGFGVSGYDWPSQKAGLLASIELLNLNCPIELVNDSLIALMAGTTNGWGVAVVAGTSCNARGIAPDGKLGRVAGYSSLGEYAGSVEIVMKALHAITKSWSRRGPKTKLTSGIPYCCRC